MENFELIDDYLSNRLSEPDQKAFEQQLNGDPALKEEVELQRQIIEGVRKARAVELKNMLNNVPVNGGSWSGGKIAAGIVSAGLIATFMYLYLDREPETVSINKDLQQEIKEIPDNKLQPIDSAHAEIKEDATVTTEPVKEKSKVAKENKITSPVRKPEIEVVDPSGEFTESKESTKVATPGRSEISPSKMEVITGVADKKHNFHYQFVQGKLMLFGPFDKSLYEILEIHGDGHAVFLFYKENYYLLDEKQLQITKLEAIHDDQLLKKLRQYRSQ